MPRRQAKPIQPQPASRRAGRNRQRPSNRADKLARARQLVRDPNYPSPQVIQAVARTLAKQWTGTKPAGRATPSTKAKTHRQA